MIQSIIDSSRPWLGLLILLPPFLYLLKQLIRLKPSALVFSDIRSIPDKTTFRTATLFIPKVIFYIAWCILVIALMGPRQGHKESKITTQGIAISMVMDISGSMQEVDMPTEDGKVISRYDMIQSVFTDFVKGNKEKNLMGRSSDMIALTVFGKYVDDLCPLTLDHSFLIDMMNNTVDGVQADIVNINNLKNTNHTNQQINKMVEKKNPIWLGTSLFDGVIIGADVARKVDEVVNNPKAKSNYTIKSKIMIVLTDGEDNMSEVDEDEAIKAAKELNVKIYSIAVHGKPVQRDVMGVFVTRANKRYNDAPLQNLAEETGGKFFRASDPASLIKIYEQIDELEKSEISKQAIMEYTPVHRNWLITGLCTLLFGLLLHVSYYRVLP